MLLVCQALPCCKMYVWRSSGLSLTLRCAALLSLVFRPPCCMLRISYCLRQCSLQTVAATALQASRMPLVSQLLFSSTSAVWSQSGSAHYAAGNAFLDYHAAASQAAGLPGTAVQYGPFADAGMAAAHVEGLASLGLKSLQPQEVRRGQVVGATAHAKRAVFKLRLQLSVSAHTPLQILGSQRVAGTASQLLYARIDARRFATIYSAKGRWSLLDHLLLTAAPTAAAAPVVGAPSGSANERPVLAVTNQQAAMQLGDVVEAVKKAAAAVLGDEMDGGWACCCSLPG